MRYQIVCEECGASYEVNLSMEADGVAYCARCGGLARAIKVGGKARIHAEETMDEMRKIRPDMIEARRKYLAVAAYYEALMQTLRVYKKRGIVEQKEVDALSFGKSEDKKLMTDAVKEYREMRKAQRLEEANSNSNSNLEV